jgi:hypothetical protein
MRLMRLIQAVIIRLQIVFLAFRFRAGPFAQNPCSQNFSQLFFCDKKYLLEESLYCKELPLWYLFSCDKKVNP